MSLVPSNLNVAPKNPPVGQGMEKILEPGQNFVEGCKKCPTHICAEYLDSEAYDFLLSEWHFCKKMNFFVNPDAS